MPILSIALTEFTDLSEQEQSGDAQMDPQQNLLSTKWLAGYVRSPLTAAPGPRSLLMATPGHVKRTAPSL